MTAAIEKTILLVEDNQEDELLTLRALKKNQIYNKVIVARDGAEALSHLFSDEETKSSVALPHFILLDLKLPKVDGLEVLKAIRNSDKTKHLPVVVLTTSNEQSDLMTSYSNGANSYVRKPVDYDQFLEVVRKLGKYWLMLNEVPHLK